MKKTNMKYSALLVAAALTLGLTGCTKPFPTPDFGGNQTATEEQPPVTEYTEPTEEYVAPAETDNAEFTQFMTDEFVESVQEDTLTLHYTLKDPSAYGISLEPTLGDLDFENVEDDLKELKKTYEKLVSFDLATLSEKQQEDYRILRTYLEDNMGAEKFHLYATAFGTVSGITCNMPINLAEYQFYIEKDITDYLTLLTLVPDYFAAAVKYEQTRVNQGLGLQDHQLDEVIKQCNDFTSVKETNYLISTFDARIDKFEGIDSAKKEEYKKQNKELVLNEIIPTYEQTAKDLAAFKGKAKISGGLCNLPDGKEYYERLVRSRTGSKKDISQMIAALEGGMSRAMTKMFQAATTDREGYEAYFDTGADYGTDDPTVILDTLKLITLDRYPEGPKTDYTIKYVEKELEETMSPAFYMIPPVDDAVENVIYINNGSTDKSGLYTTLAHEGYPGHLYQNNYYNATNPHPIRKLLNFGGYSEGWATYVELQAPDMYTYVEHDTAFRYLEEAMTELNLCIASRIDIGVNYEGWTITETENYLEENNLNKEVAQNIYDYVICEPSNYLKYYIGALEFIELRDYALDTLGEHFNIKEFNQALLDCGPCQFEYVRASVDRYIKNKLGN